MTVRNVAMLAASAFALVACAANPGPVMKTSTDKLISYFDAKQELANTLQMQLGGPTARSPRNDYYSYRLVAINGPAYQLGSVLAVNNSLDLVTRRCVLEEEGFPFERWSTMPRWSSNSTLNTDLGIPAPFQGVFNKTSVDAGLNFDSASIYSIEDIGQRFLARDEMRLFTSSGECGEYLATLNEPVVFVRGIIYGRETLKSAKGFGAGLDVRIIEEESGQLNFKYARNGAYELSDADIVPKFAVMAKIVPQHLLAGSATEERDEGERQSGLLTGSRPRPVPEPPTATGLPFDLNDFQPAAGEPAGAGYTVVPLSDEEIAALEQAAQPRGN